MGMSERGMMLIGMRFCEALINKKLTIKWQKMKIMILTLILCHSSVHSALTHLMIMILIRFTMFIIVYLFALLIWRNYPKKKTPNFGCDSTLSFDKLNDFYEYWQVFESRRSFVWITKFNLNEAENRKMRKLMHKENRKLINEKRKKWEDAILRLVAFIKKRDPRYRNFCIYQEQQRLDEERKMNEYKKEIDKIMKEEQMKQRLLKMEQTNIENNEEQPPEIEQLYECIVCDKVYKKENAFIAHKSSKKHIKALENLKFQLQIENDLIFEESVGDKTDDFKVNDQHNVDRMIAKQIAMQENAENNESEESEKETVIDLDYLLALSVEQEDIMNAVDLYEDDVIDQDDAVQNVLITDSEIIALLEQPGIDIDALLNTYSSLTRQYILDLIRKQRKRCNQNDKKWKKNKRKKRKQLIDEVFVYDDDEQQNKEKIDEETQHKDEEHDDLDEFMKKFKTFHKKSDFINKQKQRNNNQQNDENEEVVPKKKRRRRRKKNKDTQNQRNMQSAGKSSPPSSCKACNKSFGSKTKLFDHLKQFPKHALRSQHCITVPK